MAGEACLLAFTYAQTRNREGIGFIAFIGALDLSKTFGRSMFSSMWQAYQMGKEAAWLPGQHWEQLLETFTRSSKGTWDWDARLL